MTSEKTTHDSALAPEQRNRLPNLWEVLSRRTRAPVDLYSFYIYMRDTQRAVDYLDFWLDVSQHMSLCRHYVRGLRRSVLVDTPEQVGSKRASQVYSLHNGHNTHHNGDGSDYAEYGPGANLIRDRSDSFGAGNGGEHSGAGYAGGYSLERKGTSDQRLSAFLRDNNGVNKHSPTGSRGSNEERVTPPTGELPPRPSFMSHPNNSSSPLNDSSNASPGQGGNVSRQDIRASAEKILYTYLLNGSEREIILPAGILDDITLAIERDGRDDPEVFDAAKDYVFQAMERDAFPGFLRQKALGNVVHPSMMLRLIVGLVSLFGAFWTAFILIFLDRSRLTRCWLILPFTVAVYLLASHQYMLDPILAILGVSEYTFMSYQRIKEPFVHKLLLKRALMCTGVIVGVTAVLCVLFIFVPGKRL